MSNSRRSSAHQNSFRTALIARDAQCIVTGDDYEDCTPAHILPQSRPEYYVEVLGDDVGSLFNAEYGILVSDGLHHPFDRGEWALWPDGDNLVVHYLLPRSVLKRSYHGKVIPPTAFRPIRPRPNRELLLFHYAQSVRKHMRGFSAGFGDLGQEESSFKAVVVESA